MIINVHAGFAVNNTNVGMEFPTANTAAALVTRIQAAITTLQNLFAVGGGCPVSSTTFSVSPVPHVCCGHWCSLDFSYFRSSSTLQSMRSARKP